MAKLIHPVALMERPRNTPLYLEIRKSGEVRFTVAWRYDEAMHCIQMLGERVYYDIDTYNQAWRAWDVLPTSHERKATPWKEAGDR